jgi:hypothetical protein
MEASGQGNVISKTRVYSLEINIFIPGNDRRGSFSVAAFPFSVTDLARRGFV